MKRFKGIIFDFNGTLFWDSPKHKEGWQIYYRNTFGKELSDEFYFTNMHGSTNSLIYKLFFGKAPDTETAKTFGQEKEEHYRAICRKEQEEKGFLEFAPGVVSLLDFLKENSIPFAIATSSEISNVSFFKEMFPLDTWFSADRIIYDDGTVRGKPHPDLYLKAGRALNLDMKDVIIAEDAYSGILAAKNAGAGMVIGVTGDSPKGKNFMGSEYTDLLIEDFTELDRNLFLKRITTP